MWNFYDELYMGIPSGIRVEGCVIGKYWTTVRANGNIGVARTLGDINVDRTALAQSFIGKFLRDVANWMKWDSLLRASIGVAAMNAFYNRADRLENANTSEFGMLLGGKVAIIGELPNLEAGLKSFCQVTVLPLPENDRLGSEYDEAMASGYVFISGDALTNRTLPALLAKVGEGTKVSLAGVSVPAAPVLFAFDNPVHNLSGVYSVFHSTVESAAQLDLPNLDAGTAPFAVDPKVPAYVHEKAEVQRYLNSPYSATKFNSAFNPWRGRDMDKSLWSPIFKG